MITVYTVAEDGTLSASDHRTSERAFVERINEDQMGPVGIASKYEFTSEDLLVGWPHDKVRWYCDQYGHRAFGVGVEAD